MFRSVQWVHPRRSFSWRKTRGGRVLSDRKVSGWSERLLELLGCGPGVLGCALGHLADVPPFCDATSRCDAVLFLVVIVSHLVSNGLHKIK